MDNSKNRLQESLRTLAALALVLPLTGVSLNGFAGDDETLDEESKNGEMTMTFPDTAAVKDLSVSPTLNDETVDEEEEDGVDGSGNAIKALSNELASQDEGEDDELEEDDQGQRSIDLG